MRFDSDGDTGWWYVSPGVLAYAQVGKVCDPLLAIEVALAVTEAQPMVRWLVAEVKRLREHPCCCAPERGT